MFELNFYLNFSRFSSWDFLVIHGEKKLHFDIGNWALFQPQIEQKRNTDVAAGNNESTVLQEKPPERKNSEEKDINENHMKKVDSKKSVKNSESQKLSPQPTQPSRGSPKHAPPKEKEKVKENHAKVKTSAVNNVEKSKSAETEEPKAKSVIVTPDTKHPSDKTTVKTAADKTEKPIENSAIQKDTKVPDNSKSSSEANKRKAKQKSEAEALDQLKETVETMVAGMTVEEVRFVFSLSFVS